MKTSEEYNNLIELVKKALEFYGDEDNYVEKPMNNVLTSMVELDAGSQAKFALEKIKTFQDDRDEQEKEFVKNMISAIEADVSPEIIMGLISTYKTQTGND